MNIENRINNIGSKKCIRRSLRNNMTPQEVLLWSKLKNSNLGFKFRRQYSIGKYIVDFYCAQKKLIIEIDGIQHENKKAYDDERTQYFVSFGYVVLRFWNDEININMEGVLLKIKESLRSTPPRPIGHPSSSEEGKIPLQ